MIAFVRIVMQLLLARLMAVGVIADLVGLLVEAGITEAQIVDGATVFSLGLVVAIPKILERTRIGATLVEWWNLILSWGRSRSGPQYIPRHFDGHRVRV